MCNIRLKVKNYCLVGLYFWMFAVSVHLLNNPGFELFFNLFFELLFQGVLLILQMSLGRYGMMGMAGIVGSLLGL